MYICISLNNIDMFCLNIFVHVLSSFLYRNQMHYNYKLDENIFKMLIKINILPTEPNKTIKPGHWHNG